MSEAVLTVSALNEYVSCLIGGDPMLKSLRVRGEISGFKRHTSGHLYFSLKDEGALVRCVMFRQQAIGLTFQPKDGMLVELIGNASLYTRDGSFQLYAKRLTQQGEGALYQKFCQLRDRLEREGLFDPAHKKPLPFLPRCVGVVTSQTGAAVQDIIQIIGRRFPDMPIVLAPVKVQGEGAAEEIAKAIRRLNQLRACDVMIVGRGGGSMEDLWAFNEPAVAYAIHESEIPVVSAVGHETDFSIADFAADLRAPTPSAAAELAVPIDAECRAAVHDGAERLGRALTASLERSRARVRLSAASRAFYLLHNRLVNERQAADQAAERLTRAVSDMLFTRRTTLTTLTERIGTLNPLSTLSRGYAFVADAQGRAVGSANALHRGDAVTLTFQDGAADATIQSISGKE